MSDEKKVETTDVQVTGVDQAELWRKSMKAIEKSIEDTRAEVAQERATARAEVKETLYFRARPVGKGLWCAECISGMSPHVRKLEAVADTPENAMFDARFTYAQALYKAKLTATWAKARERAAKAELVMADIAR